MSYRIGDDVLSPFNNGSSHDIVSCLNSLKEEEAREIEETLFTKYSAFTKDIEKCPSESCDFVYVGDKCTWNHPENVYNCPKCEMPLIPNQTFTVQNFFASAYLLLANKCPKCDIPIEKVSGCPHMTCPCGHHFCWYCYKDHPSGGISQRVYTIHNVRECVFIFLSKIVLFLICLSSLLITFNGNSTIKWCLGMIGTIFSVIVRALILDLIVLLQVILAMMKKRRPSGKEHHKKRAVAAGLICFNLLFILLLYGMEELNFFALVLFAEISIMGVCFGVGYAIVYSIETWFEFIA